MPRNYFNHEDVFTLDQSELGTLTLHVQITVRRTVVDKRALSSSLIMTRFIFTKKADYYVPHHLCEVD